MKEVAGHRLVLGFYVDDGAIIGPRALVLAKLNALGQAITTEVAAASDYEQCFYYGEDYHRAPPPHAGAHPAPALSPA